MRLAATPADIGERPGRQDPLVALPENGLLGGWSATRWHYTSALHPSEAIDVVCDLGATITLSLSAGGYVLSWDIPGRESGSIGGNWVAQEGRIVFTSLGTDREESLSFRQRPDLLSLGSEASAWDFSGHGREEPASFIAVFVRL